MPLHIAPYRLLPTSIHSFLLSIGCTFSGAFLSRDAMRIASVCVSSECFQLVNLDVTRFNHNGSDLVLEWTRLRVLQDVSEPCLGWLRWNTLVLSHVCEAVPSQVGRLFPLVFSQAFRFLQNQIWLVHVSMLTSIVRDRFETRIIVDGSRDLIDVSC